MKVAKCGYFGIFIINPVYYSTSFHHFSLSELIETPDLGRKGVVANDVINVRVK